LRLLTARRVKKRLMLYRRRSKVWAPFYERLGDKMRFWTALQYPLHQAILVDNGKIIRSIPDHSPKTLARMVGPIGEWDDKHILVGRRSSVEMWTKDGVEMVRTVTHPWIYDFHVLQRYQDGLLLGCAGLDCVLIMDWEGKVSWSWFASKHGLSADLKGYPVPFGEGQEWQAFQLTQNFVLPGSTHLNSVRFDTDDTFYATLCHSRKAIRVRIGQDEPIDITSIAEELPHDYQIDKRINAPVVGHAKGLSVNGRTLFEAKDRHVKRVYPLGKDAYIFTHEKGVAVVDVNNKVHQDITVPRPWHVVNLEE